MNSVKVLIFDLDGTLIRSDKTISPFTLSVLQNCRQKGIKLMVATARPLRAVEEYCKTFSFDAMAVSNGARILVNDEKTEFCIPFKTGEKLLTELLSYPDFRITLETGDEAYSNVPVPDYDTVLTDDLIGIMEREGALKLIVRLDDNATGATVKNLLPDTVYHTVSGGCLMQIMDKRATK